MKYVAFDLEIADDLPESGEVTDYALGITCAATITDGGRVRVWHDNYAPRMSKEYAQGLVEYLWNQLHENDRYPVTWNGLGFDFRVLEAASGVDPNLRCRILAVNHIDIAFQMLCSKGFMASISKAAEGMNVAGKTEGMHGSLAPIMWRQGREAQDKVLEYVEQDARMTAQLYERIIEAKAMRWIARSGKLAFWYPEMEEGRLLTVGEALALPEPDTSWMSEPWDRNRFYGWVEES